MKKIIVLSILAAAFAGTAAQAKWSWVKTANGQSHTKKSDVTGECVATDPQGNIYVAGTYRGDAQFGPTVLACTPDSRRDLYLAKYTAAGALVWVHNLAKSTVYAGAGVNAPRKIVIDRAGRITVAGVLNHLIFGNDTLPYQRNIFIVRLDADGTQLWAKPLAESYITRMDDQIALAADDDGNCYVGGSYTGAGTVVGSDSLAQTWVNRDAFVCRFDPSGNPVWAKNLHGDGDDLVGGLAVDSRQNVFLSADYENDATLGSTALTGKGKSGLLAKLDRTGAVTWFQRQSSLDQDSSDFTASCLTVDASDNVYEMGYCDGGLKLGTQNVPAASNGGYFLTKLTNDGVPTWTQRFASFNAREIAATDSGSIYATGTLDGSGLYNGTPAGSNTGRQEAYVARYDESGNFSWVSVAYALNNYGYSYGFGICCHKNLSAYAVGYGGLNLQFDQQVVQCDSMSSMYLAQMSAATGVEQSGRQQQYVRLYPNPAIGKQSFLELPSEMTGQLRILDNIGRTVSETKIEKADRKIAVPTASLTPGIYQIEFSGNSQTYAAKLVVQR